MLGVDVGASHIRIAVSDLTGGVLAQPTDRHDVAEGPEGVLTWVIAEAERLLAGTGRGPSDVIAIGIGLPGPVEHSTGRPINPPIMPGWDRFDVPGFLSPSFDAPVLVDNDVNIMALGEREHAWPDVDHLIFVKVATGIGSGVISGGSCSAAHRAPPATSGTSTSRAAPRCRARAATVVASRPSPPVPRSDEPCRPPG